MQILRGSLFDLLVILILTQMNISTYIETCTSIKFYTFQILIKRRKSGKFMDTLPGIAIENL